MRRPRKLTNRLALLGLFTLCAFALLLPAVSMLADRSSHALAKPSVRLASSFTTLSALAPVSQFVHDFSAPLLFHAINGGTRIEGVLIAGKFSVHFVDYFDSDAKWPVTRNCGRFHQCTRRYTQGRCTWCPRVSSKSPSCFTGELLVSHTKEDRNMTFTRQTSVMAARRSWAHPDSSMAKPRYSTFWLQCDLKDGAVPPGQPGQLTVEGIEGFTAHVLPLVAHPPLATSIVCTRGLFGDLDPVTFAAWVDYYVNVWKFDHVVAYGIGMDRNLAKHPLVAPLIASGKLLWIDLRDELQRVYGYLWSDVLLFSHAIAQLPTKFDCLARARKMGVTWVLNIDVDEMLVPGVDAPHGSIGAAGAWSDVVRGRENESWISFGLLDARDATLCFANTSYVGRWSEYWAVVDTRMRQVEWPATARRPPFRAMSKGCDPLTCNGAPGGRKVAIRVNRPELHVPGIGVHEMRACCLCVMEPPGVVVNARQLYLRHNSCLNFPRLSIKQPESAAVVDEWFANPP